MKLRREARGIDRVQLPHDVPGSLELAALADVAAALDGIESDTTIVCLVTERALRRVPPYERWLSARAGERVVRFPIADFTASPVDETRLLVESLATRLRAGDRVLVHCGAGLGRTGTIAAGVLMALGLDRVHALATVAAARPGAGPEVPSQRRLLRELASEMPGSPA